jgi:hypothetical protein
MRRSPNSPNTTKSRARMLNRSTRRYHDVQLTLNCLDELKVIADYRRSEEQSLLRGSDV